MQVCKRREPFKESLEPHVGPNELARSEVVVRFNEWNLCAEDDVLQSWFWFVFRGDFFSALCRTDVLINVIGFISKFKTYLVSYLSFRLKLTLYGIFIMLSNVIFIGSKKYYSPTDDKLLLN